MPECIRSPDLSEPRTWDQPGVRAISSRRPYKPEFPLAECFEILEQGQGSHFDRQVVTAFAACRDRIVEIHSQYQDQQLQD